jgi:hypothetical protein
MQETHIPDISQQQEPAISVLPWKTLKHEKRMETKIIENKKRVPCISEKTVLVRLSSKWVNLIRFKWQELWGKKLTKSSANLPLISYGRCVTTF